MSWNFRPARVLGGERWSCGRHPGLAAGGAWSAEAVQEGCFLFSISTERRKLKGTVFYIMAEVGNLL